jgi:hypothetical protein
MSWDSQEQMLPERFWQLAFYKKDDGDGAIGENFNPGTRWKLAEIRVHFSSAFASVEYLTAYLSATKGSEHNVVLLSHNCSGSTDIILYYSEPRMFLSDDVLRVELSNTSGVNAIGISVFGWAVIG